MVKTKDMIVAQDQAEARSKSLRLDDVEISNDRKSESSLDEQRVEDN